MHSPVEDDSLDLSFHPAKWQLDCGDRKRKIIREGTWNSTTHSLTHSSIPLTTGGLRYQISSMWWRSSCGFVPFHLLDLYVACNLRCELITYPRRHIRVEKMMWRDDRLAVLAGQYSYWHYTDIFLQLHCDLRLLLRYSIEVEAWTIIYIVTQSWTMMIASYWLQVGS